MKITEKTRRALLDQYREAIAELLQRLIIIVYFKGVRSSFNRFFVLNQVTKLRLYSGAKTILV